MASYLVTGSSRGIGLALVATLASQPASEVAKVFAAARSASEGLKNVISELGGDRIEYVELEVTSVESIQRAVAQVSVSLGGTAGLDVLINNAANIGSHEDRDVLDMDDLDEVYKVNVGGVHNVTRAFLPLLRKANQKRIMNISSSLGSIGWMPYFKAPAVLALPAYRISKTALNMLTVHYAEALRSEGFTVIAVSPGHVKTHLDSADLTTEESVKALLEILECLEPAQTGRFFNVRVPGWEDKEVSKRYDGQSPPW